MDEQARELLRGSLDEVSKMVVAYPSYIPVVEAARMLHIKPSALRASIEQGRCPFGFCWKLGDRMAYKVPTLALCSWLLGQPV